MKALTIAVALLNFAPLFFLALGLLFLAQLVDRLEPRCRAMSLAGLVLTTLGGLAGAASNLLEVTSGEGVPLLAATLYVFGAPGFTLIAASLVRALATDRGKRCDRDPWLAPTVISWTFLIAAFYLNPDEAASGEAWRRDLAALGLAAVGALCLAAGVLGWRRRLHMAAGLFALNAAAGALIVGLRFFVVESPWIQLFQVLVNLAAQAAFAFASWRVAAEYRARVGPIARA